MHTTKAVPNGFYFADYSVLNLTVCAYYDVLNSEKLKEFLKHNFGKCNLISANRNCNRVEHSLAMCTSSWVWFLLDKLKLSLDPKQFAAKETKLRIWGAIVWANASSNL